MDRDGWDPEGDAPQWLQDTRGLEADVQRALRESGIPSTREAGRSTNVRSGFETHTEGVSEGHLRVSVWWRARYDYVLKPNEAYERLRACAAILREREFDVVEELEELIVRRTLKPERAER